MSTKDLFKDKKAKKVLPILSTDEIGKQAESKRYIEERVKKKDRVFPKIDYTNPEEFARFGSAKEYYGESIKRIWKTYPYDGSLYERVAWENSSSYLDLYLFEKEYPRRNGYAIFSPGSSWGTQDVAVNGIGVPTSADIQYISFEGGPNKDPDNKDLKKIFPDIKNRYSGSKGANIYDKTKYRQSNLQYSASQGSTIEFWMKKADLVAAAKTTEECIFDLWNNSHMVTREYGRLSLRLMTSDTTDTATPLELIYQSGSASGSFTYTSLKKSEMIDNKWHHYAVTLKTEGTGALKSELYFDGSHRESILNHEVYGTATITVTGGDTTDWIPSTGQSGKIAIYDAANKLVLFIPSANLPSNVGTDAAAKVSDNVYTFAVNDDPGTQLIASNLKRAIALARENGDLDVFVTNYNVSNSVVNLQQAAQGASRNKAIKTFHTPPVTISGFSGGSSGMLSEVKPAQNSNSGSMLGMIGAYRTISGSRPPGHGKLSASIDEFRYWKTRRNAEQIGRFYRTQVGGGTNVDDANTDLGVYFKFNEGITGRSNIDERVLDYSGRISNGYWKGYSSTSRNTGSAIVESSASATEFKDPIIYPLHPKVKALQDEKVGLGQTHDYTNNGAIYRSLPEWITSEDSKSGSELLKLTQIMASYFDTLAVQMKELPSLKDPGYVSSSHEPFPFGNRMLENSGFLTPDLFANANVIEEFLDRDEQNTYENSLYKVKNLIYQNIYNNLTYIAKTKGTEKSFRNLIRCFGVDDELINVNIYGNNVVYKFEDSARYTDVKKRYIDFNSADRNSACIFQYKDPSEINSVSFISGSGGSYEEQHGADNSPFIEKGASITFEYEAILPKTKTIYEQFSYIYSDLSSSIGGVHTAKRTNELPTTTISVPDITTLPNHDNSTALVITNTDGTTVTFATDSDTAFGSSTATVIGTKNITTTNQGAEAIYRACRAAIAADPQTLKATISNYTEYSNDSFDLTQTTGGTAGETTFTGALTTLDTATATITVTDYTAVPQDSFVLAFTLKDASGGFHNFNFDSSVSTVTNNTIGLLTVDSNNDLASNIYLAIVDSTATTYGKMTVTNLGSGVLRITQATAGTIGNQTNSDYADGITVGSFSGGGPTIIGIGNENKYAIGTKDVGWSSDDLANFQIFATRDKIGSDNVKFVLTSTGPGPVPELSSSLFYNVYDNEKWNFAVKIRPQNFPWATGVSGSYLDDEASPNYIVEFYGVNTAADIKQNSFLLTGSLTRANGDAFLKKPKRVFVGAHKTDFTGTLLQKSDVKIGSARVWMDYLSNDVIDAHARDVTNVGTTHPYESAYLFEAGRVESTPGDDAGAAGAPGDFALTSSFGFVPQIETLALHWDFNQVSGSDPSGEIKIGDFSSGSVYWTDSAGNLVKQNSYGPIGAITGRQHTAIGYDFPASTEKAVDVEYISSAKQLLPELIGSADMIKVLSADDLYFERDTRPESYYFAAEKSMYRVISEEMLNLFATIKDFNNLIGEPVNRYRHSYKRMEKLRHLFFRRLKNTPDLDKYIEYYKWIDKAVNDMIEQLFPASAAFSDKLRTVVESHVLERNKYVSKFPTIEDQLDRIADGELLAMPIPENYFTYIYNPNKQASARRETDFATILAPATQGLGNTDQENFDAWYANITQDEIGEGEITSGDDAVDETIKAVIEIQPPSPMKQITAKQPMVTRKHYIFRAEIRQGLHSGHNVPSVMGQFVPTLLPGGPVDGDGNIQDYITFKKGTFTLKDRHKPTANSRPQYDPSHGILRSDYKARLSADVESTIDNTGGPTTLSRWAGSLVSLYIDSDDDIKFTNIHKDFGPSIMGGSATLQGPFTEKWIGGSAHRKVGLNIQPKSTDSDGDGKYNDFDTIRDRPEKFRLSGRAELLDKNSIYSDPGTGTIIIGSGKTTDWDTKTVVITDVINSTVGIDKSTTGNAVTFTGKSADAANTVAKVSSTSYTFGVASDPGTSNVASSLQTAVALAKTNGDLNVTATVDTATVSLAQDIAGDSGNSRITTTILDHRGNSDAELTVSNAANLNGNDKATATVTVSSANALDGAEKASTIITVNTLTAATATITVSNAANITVNDSVELVPPTGTPHFLIATESTTTSANTTGPTYAIDASSANNTAANITTAINALDDFSATRSDNVVTVTQSIVGSDGDTAISVAEQSTSAGIYAGNVAEGTITFSGWPTPGDTITIIDTAGTSKAYVAAADGAAQDLTTNPPTFDRGNGGTESTAASLKACIESANGHNGTITVTKNAVSNELTLTQTLPGTAGNTTITDNADNTTVSNFSGGTISFSGGVGDDTISLVSIGGTTYTLTTRNVGETTTSANTTSPTFAIVASDNDSTAANMTTAVDALDDFSAARTDNVVTITRGTVGTAGNTDLTLAGSSTSGLSLNATATITFSGWPSPSTAATATITFSGGHSYGKVITIISTDGTSIDYTTAASNDYANNEWGAGGGFDDKAAALKGAIEHSSGHNGKITVTQGGSGNAVLTLTQAVTGTSGNRTITENVEGVAVTGFTGGAVGDTITIIDTAGTSKAYVAAADGAAQDLTTNPPTFDRGNGGTESTAASLKACIESANGHNGTITVTKNAVSDELTLTQVVPGTDGETTITDNADNTTVTNFTGASGFSGGTNGDTVQLISAGSTTYTLTSHAAGGTTTSAHSTSPTFATVAGDNNSTAANIVTAVNALDDFTATRTDNVVTITQVTRGTGGNTTITIAETDTAGLSKSNFTGGSVGDTIQLISAGGTTYTLTAHSSGGTTTSAHTTSPTFEIDAASAANTAANIVTAVNALDDFTATRTSGLVIITQVTSGELGNTTITITETGTTGFSLNGSGFSNINVTLSGFANGGAKDVKIYPADSNLAGVREPAFPKVFVNEGVKRVVSIKNIQNKTGSIGQGATSTAVTLGNYWKLHEIVKIDGPNNQKKWLVNNYLTAQTSSENPSFRRTNPQTDGINIDFALPSRPRQRAIFVTRFSSPGDFTTMTRGYLDPIVEEYSAYNALPWRYHFQLNSSGSVSDSDRTWRGATTPFGNTPVTSPSSLAGAKASAILTIADGDDTTSGQFTEGEYVKMIATDGTVGIYILSDAAETGAVASGTVLDASSDLGTTTPDAALLAAGTCIAVRNNLNTNSQAVVLNEFKDTILCSTSPLKDKITAGAYASVADGAQSITFTQDKAGAAGNTVTTTNISQLTAADFTGGIDRLKINDYRMNIPVHVAQHVTTSQHVLEDFAGLNVLLSRHSSQFGIDSIRGTLREEDYGAKASYHKVHRNTLKRLELTPAVTNFVAQATVTVSDGDAVTGMSEAQKIILISTDGTTRVYRIVNISGADNFTTGDVLEDDSDIGSGTGADDGDIAVVVQVGGWGLYSQNDFLVQLKAAIEHNNGHKGKIIVSSVPVEANGSQSITLTQTSDATNHSAGNTAITHDLANVTVAGVSPTTSNQFTGGEDNGGKQYIVTTGSTHDNAYVRHSIPRNDLQYSWITASAFLRRDPLGVVPTGRNYDGKVTASLNLGSLSEPYVEALTFISRSEICSFQYLSARYWSQPWYQTGEREGSVGPSTYTQRIPVDFAGMNFNIYEPITSSLGADSRNYDTASINTLGYPSAVVGGHGGGTDTLTDHNYLNHMHRNVGDHDHGWADDPVFNYPTSDTDGAGTLLNAIILHRQGPYGWPSWKQIRGAQHPIARYNRKNNIVQYVKRTTNAVLETNTQDAATYFQSPHLDEVTVAPKPVYKDTIISFITPPISSRYQPMIHAIQDYDGYDIVLKHSYGVNKNHTPHSELNRNMTTPSVVGTLYEHSTLKPPERIEVYDQLTDDIVGKDKGSFGLYYMTYRENIYPKEKFTYLAKTRGRTDYTEVSSSNPKRDEKGIWTNKKMGFQRTFWKDNPLYRRGSDHMTVTNSMGFIEANEDNATRTCPALSIWPLDGEAPPVHDDPPLYPANHRNQWVAGELLAPNYSILACIDGFHYGGNPSITYFTMPPTASQQYLYMAGVASRSKAQSDGGGPPGGSFNAQDDGWKFTHHHFYRADEFSGNKPWYDSYEEYAKDIRVMAKDHTIVPEFRISEHMDHYIDNGFIFNNKFLTLEGAYPEVSSSAAHPSASYNDDFFKTYSHSDFMKYFGKISADYKELTAPTKMTLTCHGIKKLLPYQGFYPVLRCVQLGSMFSSSFAPYISGSDISSIKTGPDGGTDNSLSTGTPHGAQTQALMQPFFAPGIMYNTIKSGIAVDWPMITGSAVGSVAGISSYNSVYLSGSSDNGELFTFRMPFEALVEPQSYMPVSQSDGSGKLLYIWHKTGSMPNGPWFDFHGKYDNKYGLAMHNFLGEVPRFFLEDESFTTFTSTPESKFQSMKSGSTYFMDVELANTHDFIMAEGPRRIQNRPASDRPALWDFRGSIYGPPCQVTPESTSSPRARLYPDGNNDGGTKYYSERINQMDPSFAPFTPPHFYQNAIARLRFSPHQAMDMLEGESRVFTLDEILSRAKIETQYSGSGFATDDLPDLEGDTAGPGPGHSTRTCGSGKYISELLDAAERDLYPAGRYRMKLSSSMNLFGKSRLKVVEYETQTGITLGEGFKTSKATDTGDSAFDVWTISTKFETPTLNFSGSNVKNLLEIVTDLDILDQGQYEFSASVGTRCMWGAYGVIPSGSEGLFVQVKESFPDKLVEPGSTTGSLMQVCGFREEKRRVGSLAKEKIISEAVLAVPFVVRHDSRRFFRIDNALIKYLKNDLSDTGRKSMEADNYTPGSSIRNMYETLQNYYLPPHMDFINNSEIDPFVIYAFEFKHKLDQQDLSDIWQNLMPKIAKNPEQEEITLCHDLTPNEFFSGQPLPEDIQWMVFKVKRKAEKSYYNVTADTEDDSRFKFTFHRGGEKKAPIYSYNWPYDFFSLVELAKIGAEVRFEPAKTSNIVAPKKMAYEINQFTSEPKIHEALGRQEKKLAGAAKRALRKQQESVYLEYGRMAETGDPAEAAAFANRNNLDAWYRRRGRNTYKRSQKKYFGTHLTDEERAETSAAVRAEIATYGGVE